MNNELAAIANHLARMAVIVTRYDTIKDSANQTRRQRNIKFGEADKNPLFKIDPKAQKLWDWFLDIQRTRIFTEGEPRPVPLVEIVAWRELTGNDPTNDEIEILRLIDQAYVASMIKEIREVRERDTPNADR